MAENLLTGDTRIDWGVNVDSELPLDEGNPHPGIWEEKPDDGDDVHSIVKENLVLEDQDMVGGDAQIDTVESTEDLAVPLSQVDIC